MQVHYWTERSARSLADLLESVSSNVVFLGEPGFELGIPEGSLDRMAAVLDDWDAGIVYSDSADQARIDYQVGSVRDDFDFGPLIGLSVPRARAAWDRHGTPAEDLRWGALYDLRLKLSTRHPLVRIPEPLYKTAGPHRLSGESHFGYVDPANRDYQIEMERVATEHLGRIGAYLEAEDNRVAPTSERFTVEASIVIPVRNREGTLSDALRSALDQKTEFPFNLIVVDNHSTDGTAGVIARLADRRVVRIVPRRTDLGIGGCWNAAVSSPDCGRIAVQLDSDDLFADAGVLARIVGEMRECRYAMLVGAYTTVDFELRKTAPGLVAHREWTPENGHNNALRVNGFGAPRAYDVGVARQIGFPNVSYGEDYAMGLRISRDYRIGRIYDSLYLCRRWEGNTDSRPTVEQLNRYNQYKDWIRTDEIRARIRKNLSSGGADG